jgi:hypothetical protein
MTSADVSSFVRLQKLLHDTPAGELAHTKAD